MHQNKRTCTCEGIVQSVRSVQLVQVQVLAALSKVYWGLKNALIS